MTLPAQKDLVETISVDGRALAYVIRAEYAPDRTTFVTPPDVALQLGFVVYEANGAVTPHRHLPIRRELHGTDEVLFVKKGRCLLDLYGPDRRIVATCELGVGDVALLLRESGHGVRMLEDTVLLEVKQGPYVATEKQAFEPDSRQ